MPIQITPSALPRRIRLTVSTGEGKPALRSGVNAVERTWLAIVPLESHCRAVRLGFANPFHDDMSIIAASVFPSDSYNPVDGAMVAGTSQGVPTGGAQPATVSFENAGRDVPALVERGAARAMTLFGDASNPCNDLRPFTICWSDWVPIRSVPRSDTQSNPLLFVYIATGRGSMSSVGSGNPFSRADRRCTRGRYVVNLTSDRPGDWTDNPTASSWSGPISAPLGGGSQWGFTPIFCLQYLSVFPGFQGVISGDSLMSGPGGTNGDAFSAAPIRAAYDLSVPTQPFCMAHLACGGSRSSVYNETLRRNLEALQPSLLVLQPLSRNDGMAPSQLDALFARLLATADVAQVRFGARTILQGAYPIPSVDPRYGGHDVLVQAWREIRSILQSMAEAGVPVYDGASIMGLQSSPWLYDPRFTDDDVHPNDLATESLTPIVRDLLARMAGL